MSTENESQEERLAATAREISAGHIPEGVTFRSPDGTVTSGPAPRPVIEYPGGEYEPEAG